MKKTNNTALTTAKLRASSMLLAASMLIGGMTMLNGCRKNEDNTVTEKTETVHEQSASFLSDPNAEEIIQIPAVKTENYSLSVTDMTYYFRTVYNSYVSMLESYGLSDYIVIDPSKSLKEQECTMASEGTWYDFFLTMTISEVEKLLACAEQAKASGIALTEEDHSQIEAAVAKFDEYADDAGVTTEEYLEALYGKKVTADTLRKHFELQQLYQKYISLAEQLADTSDGTVERIYAADPKQYDTTEYISFTFDFNDLYLEEGEQTDETGDAFLTKDRDEAVKKSREDAGNLKADLDRADTLEERQKIFEDFLKDYLTDEFGLTDAEYEAQKDSFIKTATYIKDDKTLSWAFDEHTKAGDVKMFTEKEAHEHKEGDDESALADIYTVVLITREAGRDESMATADVRHILFSKDEYEDDTKVREALEELEAVLGTDRFVSKFEELAKEYSADTANKNNGGLMENCRKGMFVKAFDEWVFGGKNAEGDLGMTYTEEYGWHIVYIDKAGLPEWKYSIVSEIRENAVSSAIETAAEKNTVTVDEELLKKEMDV